MFVQVILELPSPSPSAPGLVWEVRMGKGGAAKGQPDIDGFRGSAFSFYHGWDKRLLQEPGEGSGPSCSLERWHRPGGPSL